MKKNQRYTKFHEWRLVATLMFVSVVISMFAAESLSRLFFPSWAPRTGRVMMFWQYDATLGWAHKRNQEGRFESFGFDTFVRINSHGFRGAERSFARLPNQRRVIILGDSFVWGFGVEEDQMFTQQLEHRLGDNDEVINLGVSGYSTDQELLLYGSVGHQYQADLVVLVVATNDVPLNARPVAYTIYPKPVFELDGSSLRLTNQPVPVKNWLERSVVKLAAQSYVLNQLNRVRQSRNFRKALSVSTRVPQRPKKRHFPETVAEKVTIKLIEQLRDDVRSDGADFLVVLVDNIYAGEKFSDTLAELDIDVVALDEVMADQNQNLHLPDNLHWNADGHALVARALEKKLLQYLAHPEN